MIAPIDVTKNVFAAFGVALEQGKNDVLLA